MAFPKRGDWSEKAYSASARGFNLLADFEREMHKAYPSTKHLKFGFFSDDDRKYQFTIGWVSLKGDMFDVEDFNSTVGSRFGVRVDINGDVMYHDNYIMIMDKSYREEVILPERLAADSVFVHPSDPEYNKMKEAGQKIAKTERVKVQVKGAPDHGSDEVAKPKEDNW
jgi:hypothetical protein